MSFSPEQAERLLPVLVHIQANLDGDLSLEVIANRARLSTRHVHRLFRVCLRETPQKYVERLRLERAAFCLRFQADSVLDVALAAGFQSHEVFTRAFRRHFRLTPREYRQQLQRRRGSGDGRRTQASTSDWAVSAVRIVNLAPQHVAFIRHLGPYEQVDNGCWRELGQWLRKRRIRSQGWLLGVGHDAPGITRPEQLRFDACVTVTTPFEGRGKIGYQKLVGGPHARLSYVGPLDALPAAYRYIALEMERLRGYRCTWLPIIEVYRAHAFDEQHSLLQTDIHVPVQPIIA